MNVSANAVVQVSRLVQSIADIVRQPLFKLLCRVIAALLLVCPYAVAESWWGLVAAPELRCSPCVSDYNHYPHSVETRFAQEIGEFYGSYTGRCFNSIRAMNIKYIAALSLVCTRTTVEIWRGVVVAPESRCSPYNRDDYVYLQSVEAKIVQGIGKIYSPYTGRCFGSTRETDIEHIVATSEAHDSGLCAASPDTRRQFATDVLNLTLAAPEVNRGQKSGKDAAEWLPQENACWFAGRIVEVRRKYNLTIDRSEAETLERVLSNCASTEMIVRSCDLGAAPSAPSNADAEPASSGTDALNRWDDNDDGRITCKEAQGHGIAPVKCGHPAYKHMRDGDGDGIVCE